jgi:hypothetical protein
MMAARGERGREPADADDRVVDLDEPRESEPPVDDDDRDPAVREAAEAADDQRPLERPARGKQEQATELPDLGHS